MSENLSTSSSGRGPTPSSSFRGPIRSQPACSSSQEHPVLLSSFLLRVHVGVNHYFWNILVGGVKYVSEIFCCRRNLERR